MGITPGLPGRAEDFINESERNATPAEDVGKGVKLEDNGKFSEKFIRDRQEFIFDESGTFTVPDWGDELIVEVWGAGGSGGAGAFGGNDVRLAAAGGAGGQYANIRLPKGVFNHNDTVSVTIGAGGAAVTGAGDRNTGNTGGATSFGDFLSVTGAPGGGTNSSDTFPTTTNNTTGAKSSTSTDDDVETIILVNARGAFGGGASASSSTAEATNGQSREKLSGGGGGAAHNGGIGNFDSGDGGTSIEAGNGGNGASQSANATAQAGTNPGGGGGGAVCRTGTATSGAGGNGRVKVTVIGKIGV